MKKQLLLFTIPLLLLTATLQAQIKYWDFGAKELGAGYENMLPVEYLNALSAKLRQIDWVDAGGNIVTNYADGVGYAAKSGYENENGHSVESVFLTTGNELYYPKSLGGTMDNFQITSQDTDSATGGVHLSGDSSFTKPKMLPDIDGGVDFSFLDDSNSDRLVTTNKALTRYDERDDMPDGMDPNLFPGCVQFTTAGDKRYQSTGRSRGFGFNLETGQWITVVGSGEYGNKDDEGDPVRYGFGTGYFSFESVGAKTVNVKIEDDGEGQGSNTGPIDGTDQGDEAVRVMQFQAVDAGVYKIANRGYKIRIYRIYLGKVDVSLGAGLETKIYENGVYSKTLSTENNIRVSTDVQAVGNRIYVSNVKSSTEVKIYAITGALVKEFKTSSDVDFSFKSGLYIATVKTAEGQKSVKLLLN
ncbi:hypothetical protein CJ739_1034 [Mariniflexile rhizosphaerae]|uniref:T9SS type A sorting domain-containing protein n=1 Tax=unclassified Mariniflexile TaxID=2643887 RepID=UPI000E330C78|nr:T9SS type A sorting domain-containing protein [Mariniflexile sp. TRM1-10]AXP80127.1 hypothetical protein CJ739_1034 [Mariniflexile sp. TRM1-10]